MPRRRHLVALVGQLGLFAAAGPAIGQGPQPPKMLPGSITGQPAAPPVTPAGGSVAPAPAPVERFTADRAGFPPETDQAVLSVRLGADWLFRMNQPGGRFVPGLNPAIRQWVEGEGDLRQALATLALVEAAKFTGDERYAARAGGAVLALLAMTKPDPADPACRVPTAPVGRVGYASVTALAVYQSANPDAKLLQEADALLRFVRKQVRSSGEIVCPDAASGEPQKADPDAAGYALQAMSAALRVRPDAETRELFARAALFAVRQLKGQPASAAAAALPALVDYALMANKEPGVVAAVFDAADRLCATQVTRPEPRRAAWAGGFAAGGVEPTADGAACALALCHAARLTRQIPDAARYAKYRAAAVDGLAFARHLQFTDETAEHFEKAFRARYVVGAVRHSPSDGTLRLDATAGAVLAQLAYLQCGTEQR